MWHLYLAALVVSDKFKRTLENNELLRLCSKQLDWWAWLWLLIWETSRMFRDSRVCYPHICLLPRLHRSIVYNWSYGAYAWIGHWTQFSGIISTTLVRIWKVISHWITANFSMSGKMDEMNFWNPIFLAMGISIWGCCYLLGWDPKRPTSDYTLSICTIGLHINFSSRLCTGGQKFYHFLLWLHPCWKLPESFTIPESATRHLSVFHWQCRDPSYITGVLQ